MILFDRKNALTQIMGKRENPEETPDSLHACMKEFIEAVHASDVEKAVSAWHACFQHSEDMPHHEGPHTEED